ncbi:MAG TPA: SRPBCC family protein [Blastocatellia bacterium]|nr:SRPBCC family protein [Blastocatellia bacterium]
MTWELKHSVIANASLQMVWAWHSNVDNWARFEGDAVESITLDGPFQAGTRITTKMPGQEPRISTLTEVEPPGRSVIQMELPEAVLRFAWTFEELSDSQTRMTQHITLEGPNAEAYVATMEEFFAPNIGKGMARIAEEIARQAYERE